MLINDLNAIPGSLDKVRRLVQAIRSRESGASASLIYLYETEPGEIWEMANRAQVMTREEWTACLAILSRWKSSEVL